MSTWQMNGPHRYRLEGDTMFTIVNGPTDAPDLMTVFHVTAAIAERYGYVISVTDARLGTAMTPAARKAHAEWAREHPGRLTANIVFGAPRAPGILINLVAQALRMTVGFDMGLLFARDEAEALIFVERERARLVKAVAARKTSARS